MWGHLEVLYRTLVANDQHLCLILGLARTLTRGVAMEAFKGLARDQTKRCTDHQTLRKDNKEKALEPDASSAQSGRDVHDAYSTCLPQATCYGTALATQHEVKATERFLQIKIGELNPPDLSRVIMKQGEHGAFATFPVLGLQMQMHQPPAQENRVDW